MLEGLVAFHDLLNLLETSRAERGGNQGHGGGTLRGGQFSHAKARPRDHRHRKVGPAGPLLLVVECKQHALPLLLIERRKECIGGAHDSGGCCLRHGGA